MKFKNIEFTGVDQLINPKSDKALKGAWKNSLEHQIKKEKLQHPVFPRGLPPQY